MIKLKVPNIINEVIDFYGKDMQLNICIEELSELIKELCKDKRGIGNRDHIAEEMADAIIIINQLMVIYGNEKVLDDWIDVKLKRLQKRLDEDRFNELRSAYEKFKREEKCRRWQNAGCLQKK